MQELFASPGNRLNNAKAILVGSGIKLLALVIDRIADSGNDGNVCCSGLCKGEQRGSLHLHSEDSLLRPMPQLRGSFAIGRVRCRSPSNSTISPRRSGWSAQQRLGSFSSELQALSVVVREGLVWRMRMA